MKLGAAGAAGGRCAALCLVSMLVLQAGCAVLPTRGGQAAPDLSGRLAVRVDSDPVHQFSAAFELSGDARAGQLNLNSPLGTVLAQARWAPGLAELSVPGSETQRFADLDSLGEQALGERIPMAALFSWLRGLPWPEAPWTSLPDTTPGFSQLGWRVDLTRLVDGAIDARRDAPPVVSVRARLDR